MTSGASNAFTVSKSPLDRAVPKRSATVTAACAAAGTSSCAWLALACGGRSWAGLVWADAVAATPNANMATKDVLKAFIQYGTASVRGRRGQNCAEYSVGHTF